MILIYQTLLKILSILRFELFNKESNLLIYFVFSKPKLNRKSEKFLNYSCFFSSILSNFEFQKINILDNIGVYLLNGVLVFFILNIFFIILLSCINNYANKTNLYHVIEIPFIFSVILFFQDPLVKLFFDEDSGNLWLLILLGIIVAGVHVHIYLDKKKFKKNQKSKKQIQEIKEKIKEEIREKIKERDKKKTKKNNDQKNNDSDKQ
jgi:hypothetical protein